MKKANDNLVFSVPSEDQLRFKALCEADESAIPPESVGIGTYNEKRIHRILKKFVCDDESCFEIKLGRYVADVLVDGRITEIQTAGFAPLEKKIRFYLENTDCKITVIHPMIAEKQIIRTDKESGELIRAKRSPKHQTPIDALPELLYVSEFIGNERLEIKLFMIRADEYRYSERMRYNKKGKYDNDIIPRELIEIYTVSSADDIRALIPESLRSEQHRTSELAKPLGCDGRRLYRALSCLINLKIFNKITNGKRSFVYEYTKG